ncbi:MAG: methionine adenosyltransferase [Spirochaetia bacterium]|jgi:S-adenosylmethionine synthetase|uniref:methionine adenosyltransferase n=1 Tax=bioreactor metagenome TaxID=1076179 RepID=A0A644TUT2_9ZZZZ|nr:methionine adenosyltransferase [Spirochaetia bacterium]MCE1208544.1 methionine adenosyltransferase [Spirochaetia bacterium]NLX45287.1 methionine adenosyltransferase [Treponema sp.]HOI23525.1 methionine adenosyltransferase [Spirochaetales bacterium]
MPAILRPFTSESVSEGHPDKICDQISDAVLDACLEKDRHSRVACECYATTGLVLVGGEISTRTYVDIQEIARSVVKQIGYDNPEYGLDWASMAVLNAIHNQSPDIAQGVDGHGLKEYEGKQGAGDQGMMFGFACDETPELMPAPIILAHRILKEAARIRKAKQIPWMRPDGKSQVTVEYDGNKPVRIAAVVLSQQHDESGAEGALLSHGEIRENLIEQVIKPVLEPSGLLDGDTKYYINPTGRFVIGGPAGDTGLTGRKIIVDSYGGMGRHGGGAFSGKDPSKVDRSAAYMARYVAKNIVAAGLATRCELELAYAIGVPEPVSVLVETFGTASVEETKIAEAVRKVFDLSPQGIIEALHLKAPQYKATAAYGHFGREGFSWENADKVQALLKAL